MNSSALAIRARDGTPLARLELAHRLLAEVRSIDEVKAIHDRAQAARVYARQARLGLEAQNDSAEIKLRAERRLGQLLATLPKQDGGDAARARSVAEVAKRLGISKQAVDKRRRARKLLALETTRGFLYPAWQFGDDGVLPGLEQVLAALEAAPWAQASWFLSGDSHLGDARPLEVLHRGQLQQVLRAAAAYGEQGAA